MPSDSIPTPLLAPAKAIRRILGAQGIHLTLGGEPTYVPVEPDGAEWIISAVGPTKLRYAYAFAGELIGRFLPGAVTIYSPGKQYPGEINPRWVVNVLANRDGSPIASAPGDAAKKKRPLLKSAPLRTLTALQVAISSALRVPRHGWIGAREPKERRRHVAVLPLDHDGKRWISERWKLPGRRRALLLVNAEGPAGLRLPLNDLPPEALRRALTLEWREGVLHVFLPPLLQDPFRELLDVLVACLAKADVEQFQFEGYLPADDARSWVRIGLTADPGVLEVNMPPCEKWEDYHRWMACFEEAGAACGLRSWKLLSNGSPGGTGGGNHLIFGGPTLDQNPFFTRPVWVASLLRYFQANPCLAYFFTGSYVGASSQAPRPDESARDLYDLDLAYQYIAGLPRGDHRYLIGETLRHLHTDISGNTHRSEISFDKFWTTGGPAGGAAGLIEFRAIESLPHAAWMSVIGLLWQAIAAYTSEHPTPGPLIAHGNTLHDRYFLPSALWIGLRAVLEDLRGAGIELPEGPFREIWEWRFPRLLAAEIDGASLEVRRACEGWPLLCETPSEGGSTSRFVDTSIERLEITAPARFDSRYRLLINGRDLALMPLEDSGDLRICGARYRRTALFPSLHPGIKPHLPLELAIVHRANGKVQALYRLEESQKDFVQAEPGDGKYSSRATHPAVKANPALLTYDLRLE